MKYLLNLLLACGLAVALSACGAAAKQHKQMAQAGEALRLEIAQLFIEKGAREQAIPLLRRVLAADPMNDTARILYASVLRDLGLYPEAKGEFEKVFVRHSKSPGAHSALGILYDLQRDFDQAKVHHHKAVTYAPGRADYFNNLGFSYFLSQQPGEAIKYYKQALALDPGLGLAYNNLGFAYGQLGHYEKAEKTFRTSLGDAGAYYNMALVYELNGKLDDATKLRKRAFKKDPELRTAYLESKESD